MGIVDAVWAGAGVALASLIAWLLLVQTLDPARLIGVMLIIGGVVVLNLFSKSTTTSRKMTISATVQRPTVPDMDWLLLCVAIAAETVTTAAFKLSADFTKLWPSVAVVCFFFFSTVPLVADPRLPTGWRGLRHLVRIWRGFGEHCGSLHFQPAPGPTSPDRHRPDRHRSDCPPTVFQHHGYLKVSPAFDMP